MVVLFGPHMITGLACSSESTTNDHRVYCTTTSTGWLVMFLFPSFFFSSIFQLYSYIFFPCFFFSISSPCTVCFFVFFDYFVFQSFSGVFRFSFDLFFTFPDSFFLICFLSFFFPNASLFLLSVFLIRTNIYKASTR